MNFQLHSVERCGINRKVDRPLLPELIRQEAWRVFQKEGYSRQLLRWQTAQTLLAREMNLVWPTQEQTRTRAEQLWLQSKDQEALSDWLLAEQNVLSQLGWTRELYRELIQNMAFENWDRRSSNSELGSAGSDWFDAERRASEWVLIHRYQPANAS